MYLKKIHAIGKDGGTMIKKFLCTITAVALITCFLAGCDKSNSEHTQGQVDTTDGEHTHEWVDATCEHPKTCSICDTTEGNALPHEYLNGTCTVCGSDNPQFLADYKQAQDLINSGKYEEAYEKLKELGDFKDAKVLLSRFHYALVTWRKSGSYSNDVTVSYGENNLPKQMLAINYNGDKVYNDFTYDEKGNIISCTHTNANGSRDFYDYVYDSNGKLIKKVPSSGNYVTYYYYGSNGKVSRMVNDYTTGYDYTYEYTYDSANNLTKETLTYNGRRSVHDHTYDANGKLIKTVLTYADGNKDIIEYTYNASGQLVKEFTTKYTNQPYTYTYEYDANGNLIKETYTSLGSPITTQYTYNLVYIPYDIDKLPYSPKNILEGYSIFLNSINQ